MDSGRQERIGSSAAWGALDPHVSFWTVRCQPTQCPERTLFILPAHEFSLGVSQPAGYLLLAAEKPFNRTLTSASMPNIVGIWDLGASENSIHKLLKRQLERVRVPNIGYQEYTLIHPGFGVGLQDHGILENGPQPFEARDGRTQLIIDGEIFNCDELRRKFRDDLDVENLSDGEFILELISTYGFDVINLLNGLFILVLYEHAESRLTLISDRCGFRPLFYVQRGDTLIFGSELKSLCAVDPEPRKFDEIGTLELFSYGSHIHNRSWLQGYLRLPPATILAADRNGIGSAVYWRYKYDEAAPRLDQPTYWTLFGTLLDRAVERNMKGSQRIGLFLSGGYDSRSVAASIGKYHYPITAFTFGRSDSRDVRYAAMLAERLGLKHVKLTDVGPYLARVCRPVVWRTEGMLPFSQTMSMSHHSIMKETADILLVGFLGEACGSHVWPQLLMARSRRVVMNAVFTRMLGGRLANLRQIFNPAFFESAFQEMRYLFDKSFDSVENDQPLNVADSWRMINLHPRTSYHAPSVDRYSFEVRAPHLDYSLTDFLLSIPPYSRLEQRIYKKMIFHRFPEIRDIPCTNSGRPINPNFLTEYSAMVLRYAGRKLWGPLQAGLRIDPGLGRDPTDMNAAFRAEAELIDDILDPLLVDNVFPERIFDRDGIRTLISGHYEKNSRDYAIISMLISWGLAVKFFLHDDFSDVPEMMLSN